MCVASLTTHTPKDAGVLVDHCDSWHHRQVQSLRCCEDIRAILGINLTIQPLTIRYLKLLREREMSEVAYLPSVLYVLQMMAGEDEGWIV